MVNALRASSSGLFQGIEASVTLLNIFFFFLTVCRSNGSRVLTRHTSVTEMPGKRREIVVPGKAKPKAETRKKEKEQGMVEILAVLFVVYYLLCSRTHNQNHF